MTCGHGIPLLIITFTISYLIFTLFSAFSDEAPEWEDETCMLYLFPGGVLIVAIPFHLLAKDYLVTAYGHINFQISFSLNFFIYYTKIELECQELFLTNLSGICLLNILSFCPSLEHLKHVPSHE